MITPEQKVRIGIELRDKNNDNLGESQTDTPNLGIKSILPQ
jgi:hypothetical protein